MTTFKTILSWNLNFIEINIYFVRESAYQNCLRQFAGIFANSNLTMRGQKCISNLVISFYTQTNLGVNIC